ncbi:MAG: hypothetical protein GC193_10205 [Cryomorphaceae bacterium]|nr:hypothetical protein [Cryomorphaceae bacterium]
MRTFTMPQEAYMAKLALESRGIEVKLEDELTVQVLNFYSNAIGGIKLFVEADRAAFAYRILVEDGYEDGENLMEQTAFESDQNQQRSAIVLKIVKIVFLVAMVVFIFMLFK